METIKKALRDPAELATGFMATRMLHVATKLGIAELFEDGTAGAEEIARATGSHPSSLARLLRGLADLGFLAEDEHGRFRLTATGKRLRRDHHASIAPLVLECGEPHVQAAWAELGHAVRTGGSAFYYALGAEYWAYVGRRPSLDAGAGEFLSADDRSKVAACDFSGVETLIDVGGGRGELLLAILEQSPWLRGTVFDLPELASAATTLLGASPLGERATFVGGDFFTEVPVGADVYLLANIVRDWGDADAVRILRTCLGAMRPESRLLVVEPSTPDAPAVEDLHRMVLFGLARERSLEELHALISSAGFRPGRARRAGPRLRIIEACPNDENGTG